MTRRNKRCRGEFRRSLTLPDQRPEESGDAISYGDEERVLDLSSFGCKPRKSTHSEVHRWVRVESQPVQDSVTTRVTLEVELSEPDVGERRSQHARVSEDDHRLSVRSGLEKLSHRVYQAEGDKVVEETQTEDEGRPEVRPSQVDGHGGKE